MRVVIETVQKYTILRPLSGVFLVLANVLFYVDLVGFLRADCRVVSGTVGGCAPPGAPQFCSSAPQAKA